MHTVLPPGDWDPFAIIRTHADLALLEALTHLARFAVPIAFARPGVIRLGQAQASRDRAQGEEHADVARPMGHQKSNLASTVLGLTRSEIRVSEVPCSGGRSGYRNNDQTNADAPRPAAIQPASLTNRRLLSRYRNSPSFRLAHRLRIRTLAIHKGGPRGSPNSILPSALRAHHRKDGIPRVRKCWPRIRGSRPAMNGQPGTFPAEVVRVTRVLGE